MRIPLGLMIQVDTLCHKIPNFIEKAKRAGVTRVFIGLENVNPDNLAGAKKRQNKVTEYRRMLLAWKAQGILTLAGYILGFPADTPETIRRDIAHHPERAAGRHHRVLLSHAAARLGGPPDALEEERSDASGPQRLRHHPRLRAASENDRRRQWRAIYQEAWSLYYSREHMVTLLRRAAAIRPADGQPDQDAGDLRDLGQPGKSPSARIPGCSGCGTRANGGRGCRAKAPGCSGRALPRDAVSKHAGIVMAIGRLAAGVADDRPRPQVRGLYGPGADAGRR